MHDAYIGGRSENNIKCIVHDDLGWKTEQLDKIAGFLPCHSLYEWFSQVQGQDVKIQRVLQSVISVKNSRPLYIVKHWSCQRDVHILMKFIFNF